MRNVLFVDDEAQVLEGLRDMLRSRRREWKMVFALGGELALEELSRERFDVIVSDMRMPGMDGATLLRRVREDHPDVVRIVLSGYTELEAALRAVPVAHQFLAKPCEPGELRRVIDRFCALQDLLSNEAVRRAVVGAGDLPCVPEVYAALVEALSEGRATVEELAEIVEGDMVMCAKLLQVVNSAFFGLGRRIVSIRDAIVYLGIPNLRTLVLSIGIFRAMEPDEAIEGFSVADLKRHSALVSRLASQLPNSSGGADDATTAGMVHDIGKLFLGMSRGAEFENLLRGAGETEQPLHRLESETLQATHAEIGAYLLGLWGLPAPVVEAVANHHAPGRVTHRELGPLTAVHVANALTNEQGRSVAGDATLDEAYLEECGVAGRVAEWRELAARIAGEMPDSCL